jgi:hypothetical protein
MQVEELERLSKKALRSRINECFATADEVGKERGPLYEKAHFYMSELQHRRDSTVAARDLVLEIVVIALIGWEIHMGYRQELQQTRSFDQEQIIWKNMEASSDATAKQSQTTAKILESLSKTMESTKTAVERQLAVSYDPQVLVHFILTERLNILNSGHTSITLWGSKLASDPAFFLEVPSVLPPNGGYEFNAETLYKELSERLGNGSPLSFSYGIYIKNELGRKYVVDCTLTAFKENLQVHIATQVNAISRREWQKR